MGEAAAPAVVALIEAIGVELSPAGFAAAVVRRGGNRLVLLLAGRALDEAEIERLRMVLALRPDLVLLRAAAATRHRVFDLGPFGLDEIDMAAVDRQPLASLCRLVPAGEDALVAQIARRHGLPYVDLSSRHDFAVPPALTPPQTVVLRTADIRFDGQRTTVLAPPIERLPDLVPALLARPSGRRLALTTPRRLEERLRASLAARTERTTSSHIDGVLPDMSARRTPSPVQKAGIVCTAVLFIAGALLPLPVATTVVSIASALAFLGLALIRLGASTVADLPPPPVRPLSDADLPTYTLLVALYQEANMLAQLSAALDRLDYPCDRLDVIFLVEEDDTPTRVAAGAAVQGRAHMRVMAVPAGRPRTKPRALAYGLAFSRASLVAVYDAEDRPHRNQLRVAAAALVSGPADLACVQARLEIVGTGNWLQRQFLIEYASLFSGILPWLAAAGLPLPLGGTSNHFKRRALAAVGGWDPYNVTEDADLGVRLARFGYRTGVIDSLTLESAPRNLSVWLRQRRRWVKGWLLTFLVHAARPGRLFGDLGPRSAAIILLHVTANILSPLLYPVWLLTMLLYATGYLDPPGEDLLGDIVLVSTVISLTIGFTSALLVALLALGNRRTRLTVELLTLPFYWCLGSWAAWRAVVEVLVSPHSWAKTPHEPAAQESTPPAISPARAAGWLLSGLAVRFRPRGRQAGERR